MDSETLAREIIAWTREGLETARTWSEADYIEHLRQTLESIEKLCNDAMREEQEVLRQAKMLSKEELAQQIIALYGQAGLHVAQAEDIADIAQALADSFELVAKLCVVYLKAQLTQKDEETHGNP